jgi:ribosomal protein L7/L12
MVEATAVIVMICLGFLTLVLIEVSQIQKRTAALARVESKLDLLLKNAGIQYDPFVNLSTPVLEALQRDDKILAIKHYREATGVGLREAKEFIEEVQKRAKGPA